MRTAKGQRAKSGGGGADRKKKSRLLPVRFRMSNAGKLPFLAASRTEDYPTRIICREKYDVTSDTISAHVGIVIGSQQSLGSRQQLDRSGLEVEIARYQPRADRTRSVAEPVVKRAEQPQQMLGPLKWLANRLERKSTVAQSRQTAR